MRAANAVLAAFQSGASPTRALEALRDPASLVYEWFDEHHGSIESIAFVVATAVLEESTYLTLSDAAVELLLLLDPTAPTPAPARFRRSMLSGYQWTELLPAEADVDGRTAETVRFRSALVQPAVLGYVWNEFDGARPALLSWLRKLVAHRDIEVRARAATAAGMLAAGDLQYALHRYLISWAASDAYPLRQSAALALGFVGAMPRHADRVWALLREWVDMAQSGRPFLASTAALALGGPLGSGDPRRALKALRTLLDEGRWSLLESVALSLLQLVHSGHATEVLDALAAWTVDQDESPLVVKALVSFVIAVSEPALRDGGVEDRDAGLPRVRVFSGAGVYGDRLSELWGRALNCAQVRPLALEALREWLRTIDLTGVGYHAVLDILAGISDRGDRDFKRLEYYLDIWAADEDDPSDAAANMLQALLDAG